MRRGPSGPPRSRSVRTSTCRKGDRAGSTVSPQGGGAGRSGGPHLGLPGPRGAPATRGRRGSPALAGRPAAADAGAPTCTASLAMSSRRPPGVPARREGQQEERACAPRGAGKGRARRESPPARGPLRPAPLGPRLAWPPRPRAAPSGPSGRRARSRDRRGRRPGRGRG